MIQIDMEKPTVCGDCRFIDYAENDYPFCLVLRQHRGYPFDVTKKKFPNCPLQTVEEKKEDQTEVEKLKHMCKVLINRNKATGGCGGFMCVFCGLRKQCDEIMDQKEGEADHGMQYPG